MVSITNSGVTYTFNDGDVESIRTRISSNIEQESMPGLQALNALLFDFDGVIKIITIKGIITNTGTNTLSSGTAITNDEQRKWLELNINGTQTGTTTFNSNYSSSYNGSSWVNSTIMFGNIEFEEITNTPNGLIFTATLLVGGQ